MKKISFGNAKWISPGGRYCGPMFRKVFSAAAVRQAKITIGCCGFFEGYLNGKPITEDKFVPLNTDFHKRENLCYNGIPFEEELAHRLYCPVYDVTGLLTEGDNVLAFMVGPGWYERVFEPWEGNEQFGTVKLCYLLEITFADGHTEQIVSDERDRVKESFVKKSNVLKGETHDYTDYDENWKCIGFDDTNWDCVTVEAAPVTALYEQECPADRVIRTVPVKRLWEKDGTCMYDAGEILSGYPIIQAKSGNISLRYGELLDRDGQLIDNGEHGNVYGQHTRFIGAEGKTVHSQFTWYCFRYIEVTGDAEILECLVIHSNTPVTSAFRSDNAILNWLHDAFVRAQLCNMHGGIPSDCPHAERRGYTGDGQLASRAVMSFLDVQAFYKKWIYDISDCQDRKTGRVQYTAPMSLCGGGPGGWGGAIVLVPYYYYKHYGDKTVLADLYPQMLRYFDYMEAHSEQELVTSDRPNVWCLGEWCTPEMLACNDMQGIKIPNPYVNTYFYIKTMELVLEIEKILGVDGKGAMLRERINRKKAVMTQMYFDVATGDFCENRQGANLFAIDIGLGDDRTLSNTVSHYEKLGHYDTGIFGTELATRLLFQKGYADVAYKLLTSKDEISFYNQMQTGATTTLEYWNGSRSQCHPMFGAASVNLAEYILGIRQTPGSAGYEEIVIAPACMEQVKRAGGYITTVKGKISVAYDEDTVRVSLPGNVKANILVSGKKVIVSRNG